MQGKASKGWRQRKWQIQQAWVFAPQKERVGKIRISTLFVKQKGSRSRVKWGLKRFTFAFDHSKFYSVGTRGPHSHLEFLQFVALQNDPGNPWGVKQIIEFLQFYQQNMNRLSSIFENKHHVRKAKIFGEIAYRYMTRNVLPKICNSTSYADVNETNWARSFDRNCVPNWRMRAARKPWWIEELAQLKQDLFLYSLRQSSIFKEAVSGNWKSLKKLQHLQPINSQLTTES